MRLILLLLFFTLITLPNIFGQTQEKTIKNTNSHEHKNEIGISISPAYFVNENVMTFAMHIHYTRNIPNTKFGIGISFERIVLAPKHSTFGLVFVYRPIERLSLALSPGITFEDNDSDALFAMHIETAYVFDLGSFHIGPAFEFAYDPNDYHLSLGIHVGYGF